MPKHGDVREDGKIFWGYSRGAEDWRDPIKFKAAKKRNTERNIRLRNIRKRWLNIYKVRKGCAVCGYDSHPVALQFDHINPKEKTLDVANMTKHKLKVLIAELRKCRILCANCHMIHTHGGNT